MSFVYICKNLDQWIHDNVRINPDLDLRQKLPKL